MLYYTPLTDFAGALVIILFGVFGYHLIRKVIAPGLQQSETERKCYVVEDAVIEGIAKKKGYNIVEIDARAQVIQEKSFHRMLRDQAVKEFFGDKKQ